MGFAGVLGLGPVLLPPPSEGLASSVMVGLLNGNDEEEAAKGGSVLWASDGVAGVDMAVWAGSVGSTQDAPTL